MDLRVFKTVQFRRPRSLEASVDFNNLFNVNTSWDVRTLSGTINLRQDGRPDWRDQYRAAVPVAGVGLRPAEHPLQRRVSLLGSATA